MFRISKDSPAYYLTSVTKDRLPVFRTTALAKLACNALDEARNSANLLIFAYVVMPDHLHAIVGSNLKPSRVLQYINGIMSRRVIDHLKKNGHESSLVKLRHEERDRKYRYSLWDHHANAKLLTSDVLVIEKAHYIHQNPVRAGLVENALDYLWSSARCWARKELEDETLRVDFDEIEWRKVSKA